MTKHFKAPPRTVGQLKRYVFEMRRDAFKADLRHAEEWHSELVDFLAGPLKDPLARLTGVDVLKEPIEYLLLTLEDIAGAAESGLVALRAGDQPGVAAACNRIYSLRGRRAVALEAYREIRLEWLLRSAPWRARWPTDSKNRAIPFPPPSEENSYLPEWMSEGRRTLFSNLRRGLLHEVEPLQRTYKRLLNYLDAYVGPEQASATSLAKDLRDHIHLSAVIAEKLLWRLVDLRNADLLDETAEACVRERSAMFSHWLGRCETIGSRLDTWAAQHPDAKLD